MGPRSRLLRMPSPQIQSEDCTPGAAPLSLQVFYPLFGFLLQLAVAQLTVAVAGVRLRLLTLLITTALLCGSARPGRSSVWPCIWPVARHRLALRSN